MSPRKKGRPFVLVDQTFLAVAVLNAHPLAAVREAVKNALEAGARFVDIFASSKGMIVISDSGHGMSKRDLFDFMEGLGSGSKSRGREGNMGVGLKAVAARHNPAGTIITSWKKGAKCAHRIILGSFDVDQHGRVVQDQLGLVEQDGELVKEVPIPTSIRGGKHTSGTIIELSDTAFRPYVVRRYLNDRFLSIAPEHEVKVWHEVSGRKEPLSVDGTIDCLREICDATGMVSLSRANLYWGIRKDLSVPGAQASYDAILANKFSGASVYYSWKNESYKNWEYSKGGRMKLGSWGIRSGAKEICLIIEAKDTSDTTISPSIDRQAITGWNEEETQQEVLANMPQELLDFMNAWERAHFDDAFEAALVSRLLREMEAPRIVRTAESRQGSSSSGSNGKGGASSDRSRPSRPSVRSRGHPSFAYVDGQELDSVPLVYDQVTHRILINRDHPVLSFLDGAKNEGVRTEARAWIAAQVINAFSIWVSDRSTEPDDEHLLLALGGALGTAQLKVRYPNRFNLPKVTTEE